MDRSPSAGGGSGDLPRHLAARRTAWAAAVGGVAAAVASGFLPWQATVLVGWLAGALLFLARVWRQLARYDPAGTAAHARREDDSRVAADLTVLAASVASLVAVGLMLVKTAEKGGSQALFTGLSVLSVVVSWAVVHTVFTLAYARLHYGDDPGGIAFPDDPDPDYRDFAYVAFTIGMTYQVSDTDLRGRMVRATALRHALLSYLFGTAVIAVTINLVAGLAK